MVIEFIRNQGNLTQIHLDNQRDFLSELNFWGIDPDYFKIERSDFDIVQDVLDKFDLKKYLRERTDNEFLKNQLAKLESMNLQNLRE